MNKCTPSRPMFAMSRLVLAASSQDDKCPFVFFFFFFFLRSTWNDPKGSGTSCQKFVPPVKSHGRCQQKFPESSKYPEDIAITGCNILTSMPEEVPTISEAGTPHSRVQV